MLSKNKLWDWNERAHVVIWGANRIYVIDDSGEIEEEYAEEEAEEKPERLICLD